MPEETGAERPGQNRWVRGLPGQGAPYRVPGQTGAEVPGWNRNQGEDPAIEYLGRMLKRDLDDTGESGVCQAMEATIEYLNRLLQRDLDDTGGSGVYLNKEPIIEYLHKFMQRDLNRTGESRVYLTEDPTWEDWHRGTSVNTGESGVYLAKETVIQSTCMDRLVQRDLVNQRSTWPRRSPCREPCPWWYNNHWWQRICLLCFCSDDPNTVFRGNTLGTKSVDQYMKVGDMVCVVYCGYVCVCGGGICVCVLGVCVCGGGVSIGLECTFLWGKEAEYLCGQFYTCFLNVTNVWQQLTLVMHCLSNCLKSSHPRKPPWCTVTASWYSHQTLFSDYKLQAFFDKLECDIRYQCFCGVVLMYYAHVRS